MCAECEQKNPIEKPFKFCMRRSVTLCTECEQKNPIEKAIQVLYASERHVVHVSDRKTSERHVVRGM